MVAKLTLLQLQAGAAIPEDSSRKLQTRKPGQSPGFCFSTGLRCESLRMPAGDLRQLGFGFGFENDSPKNSPLV